MEKIFASPALGGLLYTLMFGGAVLAVLALAWIFLPITLGIVTFFLVLMPIWYALHVHLVAGVVLTVLMLTLVLINYNYRTLGPAYHLPVEDYHYDLHKIKDGVYEYRYVKMIQTHTLFCYSILRKPYIVLMGKHIAYFSKKFKEGLPEKMDAKDYRLTNTGPIVGKLSRVAFVWPAYAALGLGTLMTLAYLGSVVFYGEADPVFMRFIHWPWSLF